MSNNKEKLDKCIRDLKLILETEQTLSKLEILKSNCNVDTLLEYALTMGIIKDLEDTFYIVNKMPEISEKLSACIRKSPKKEMLLGIINTNTNNSSNPDEYRYSGTYNSWSEVPGYNTEWNDRCRPSGVTIRGSSNCRC
jgi:hypothetical protein